MGGGLTDLTSLEKKISDEDSEVGKNSEDTEEEVGS